MDAINQGAKAINDGIAYLRNNAWPIAIMLAMWFFVRPKVLEAMEDLKNRRSPKQVKDYNNDMARVRRMQQLQAEQDAKIKAEQLSKEKKASQEEKKNNDNKKASTTNKTTTSKPKTTTTKPSYSGPSMNHFSTPSYRPQRRTVRRG